MATGYSSEVFKSYTSAVAKLGTLMEAPDGSRYRFALNGTVAQVAGNLVQSPLVTANHLNVAVQAAQSVGGGTITVTLGATAAALNEYADGYAYINDGGADIAQEGYKYRIKSHPAADSGGVLVLTLYEDSPVKIALTTNGKVTLVHNAFWKTIIHPSPPTGPLAGVAPTAVPANAYYWCQTRGDCPVLTQGALLEGDMCVASATVDGAVMPSAAFETDGPGVGRVRAANATGERSLIALALE